MRSFALLLTSTALAGALLGGCADGMFGKSSTATPSTAAQQAAAERQPSSEVRGVQQQLTRLGYYNGTVDGLWGPDTQIAVQKYQRERGLTVSSALDDQTRAALSREAAQDRMAQRATDNHSPNTPGTAPAGTSMNRSNTGTMGQQAAGTQGEYTGRQQVGQNTRSPGVSGRAATSDERRMQDISPAAGPSAGARSVSPRKMTQASVRNVQQKLADEGQYQARVDGVWGPRSQKALVNFQTQNGLRADGVIGPRTANALGLDLKQLSANTGTRGMGGGSMDSGTGSGAMSPGSTGPSTNGGGSGSMTPGNSDGVTSPGGSTGSGTGSGTGAGGSQK